MLISTTVFYQYSIDIDLGAKVASSPQITFENFWTDTGLSLVWLSVKHEPVKEPPN